MSSLAQILKQKGKTISGSDQCKSKITKNLEKNGIKFDEGHNEKNINKKHQIIIYSPAIPKNNVEMKKARALKIITMTYPEALGEFSEEYFVIAIAGTHGKSTTTAMAALVLEKGGLDPTVVIGTKMKAFKNRNYKVGKSKYLIIEACEYKRSFLNFKPDILVITNLEADHLDYYKNLADYSSAFEKLGKNVKKGGTIIINKDDKNSYKLEKKIKKDFISWSRKKPNSSFNLRGKTLTENNKIDQGLKIDTQVAGEFNVENATFAAIVGKLLKIENKKIEQGVRSFKGTWRRMEYKTKKFTKAKFIDDYGHHPTEIESTLNAIREGNQKAKILCIFQPHQYSRTILLMKSFGKSFDSADQVIIPNIYAVRDSEEDMKKISTTDLVNEIKKHNKHARNGGGLEKTAEYIKKYHKKYDIIVTMGAGDITSIYKML